LQPFATSRRLSVSIVEATDIRKTYRIGRDNVVQALRGVDLRVEPREMVALVGPSGSGKSTLLHVLGLLHLPDRDGVPPPVLRLAGRDAVEMSDGGRTALRSRSIGFVFQAFNLVGTLTALENVALAAEYAGAPRRAARLAAAASLERVGLGDRVGHRPSELSGGQQQRVAIARAIVNDPAVVLADEPTGNLDSRLGQEVIAILNGVARSAARAVVLVTHDPAVAAAADRVVRLRDGLIVDDADQADRNGRIDPRGDREASLRERLSVGGESELLPDRPGGHPRLVAGARD
jgi:putative ABC transport system ATP-binding protein